MIDHSKHIKTRIAPTPSGFLHVGNIYNFLLTWLINKKNQGSMLLRIDDIDASRVRDEYLEDIFRTLDWLNIDYEFGPSGVDDFKKHYSQQLKKDRYQEILNQLKNNGDLFACSCSRKMVSQNSIDGLYAGTCHHALHHYEQDNISWRIFTDDQHLVFDDIIQKKVSISLQTNMKDFVVRKKDKSAAYQIASLADDIDYGTNLFVRGEDLLTSTAAQIFLSRKLGNDLFDHATLIHHPLVQEEGSTSKLSKSAGSLSLKNLRENGKKPEEIYHSFLHFFFPESKIIPTKIDDLLEVDLKHHYN